MVDLYWHIGRRIREDVLGNDRADYGKQIVSALRRDLSWTHFKDLIYLDDRLKREFYAERMTRFIDNLQAEGMLVPVP